VASMGRAIAADDILFADESAFSDDDSPAGSDEIAKYG